MTERVPSALYSEREIDDAIKVAEKYFKQHFDGCTLTTISYAGDEKTADWADRTELYGGSEVIVLTSSFLTDRQAGGILLGVCRNLAHIGAVVIVPIGSREIDTHKFGHLGV